MQGRLNDIGILLASHAQRSKAGGTYTPESRALLEDVARYVRLYHMLFWACQVRPALGDEGVSFSRDFIGKGRNKKAAGQFLSLNDKERKQMDKGCIEPLTLFQGKQSVTSLGIERSCANL